MSEQERITIALLNKIGDCVKEISKEVGSLSETLRGLPGIVKGEAEPKVRGGLPKN